VASPDPMYLAAASMVNNNIIRQYAYFLFIIK
jgi:hypothetical protein